MNHGSWENRLGTSCRETALPERDDSRTPIETGKLSVARVFPPPCTHDTSLSFYVSAANPSPPLRHPQRPPSVPDPTPSTRFGTSTATVFAHHHRLDLLLGTWADPMWSFPLLLTVAFTLPRTFFEIHNNDFICEENRGSDKCQACAHSIFNRLSIFFCLFLPMRFFITS